MAFKSINFCKKIIIFFTLFSFVIVLFNAMYPDCFNTFLQTFMKKNIYFYCFFAILFTILLLFIFKIIDNLNEKTRKYIKLIAFTFLFFIQLVLFLSFNIINSSDAYFLSDGALSIEYGKITEWQDYFVKYSNNNFCALIISLLINFMSIFGITNYLPGLILFNTLMIDISILILYKFSRKLKGESFALKVLILLVLNPLNYLLIHWVYTNTLSLPFMVGIIYVALLIYRDNFESKKSILYSVLFGLLAIIGLLLRATLIVPLIAVVMCFIVYIIYKNEYFSDKNFLRKVIFSIFLSILTFLSGYFVFSYVEDKCFDNSKSFPVTHWIMMGLHTDGSYNTDDEGFTFSFESKKEMRKANTLKILEAINDNSISGLLNHGVDKLNVNWANGTADYFARNSFVASSNYFYEWIAGDKKDFVVIYCQVFRIVMLFLLCVCLINQLKLKKWNWEFAFTVILFGALLFYLLWEVKSSYSVPFLPFVIFLMALGGNHLNKKVNIYKVIKKYGVILIIITFLLMVLIQKGYTEIKSTYRNYSIYSIDIQKTQYIVDISKKQRKIIQEFNTFDKFNSIALFAKKINNSDLEYSVNVFSGNNKIFSENITSSDIQNENIILNLDSKNYCNNGRCKIVIFSDKKGEDSIGFGHWYSKGTDQYDGNLYVDNNKKTGDMKINVYFEYTSSFISLKKYYFIVSFIILFELIIFFVVYRRYKNDG